MCTFVYLYACVKDKDMYSDETCYEIVYILHTAEWLHL